MTEPEPEPFLDDITARRIEHLVDGLLAGTTGLHELPTPLADLYHLGLFDGRAQMWPELEAERDAANRLYNALHDPQPIIVPGDSLADLERRRGFPENGARADAIEQDLARRGVLMCPAQAPILPVQATSPERRRA